MLAALSALLLFAAPASAWAVEVSFKLEPGVSIPLSAPQNRYYDVGGGQSTKVLFGVTRFLEIGPTFSFMLLPPNDGMTDFGGAWMGGAGARLFRPRNADSVMGISPWVDADLLYVRTGQLNRAGLDAAVGLSIPLEKTRMFWVGPFVRYLHIFQGDRAGFDTRDANLLTIGLSFEVSTGNAPVEPVQLAEAPAPVAPQQIVSCPDRDNDSMPDTIDRCPDVVGSIETFGCPNYKKVVVKADKLELKEKLYFAWDAAVIEEASFSTLDEVAQALKDNPGFRVQVEGHADASGNDDHNQTLSEKRAAAVLDYLAAHGVARERLVSKGFSSSQPLDTNQTVAGREANRRVEFVVFFNLLKDAPK